MTKKREDHFIVTSENWQSTASVDYISFQAAYDRLNKEFQATKEEIALWTFFGRKLGGLTAYADNKPYPKACSILNRWKPPLPKDCADTRCGRCQSLYIAPRVFEMGDALNEAVDTNAADLMSDCYFLREVIEQFEPNRAGRYITGAELLERWKTFGLNEAEIKNKVHGRIAADELEDAHPIFGSYLLGPKGIPFERAMFPRAQIEMLELRDFLHSSGANGLEQKSAVMPSVGVEDVVDVKLILKREADNKGKIRLKSAAERTAIVRYFAQQEADERKHCGGTFSNKDAATYIEKRMEKAKIVGARDGTSINSKTIRKDLSGWSPN